MGLRTGRDAGVAASGARHTDMMRVIIGGAAALAMALCFYELSRPGTLFGVTEYDDGAYFGSAIRMVHGALPYRDFVLVQPPGFELLASPFALLSRAIGTRDALATARLFMPLVAAANVVLVGMLMRHRGQLATLVAAGLMAVYPSEVHASHTLLLEPLLDLFCLLGAVLAFSGDRFAGTRRMLLGGVMFGFAGTIKGWALIPVLVIVVLCAVQARRRLGPFLGGVAAGFVVPTLPFALAAPTAFFHQVVLTQLGRVGYGDRVPLITRLGDLTGGSAVAPGTAAHVASIVLVTLIAALAVALLVRARRRARSTGSCSARWSAPAFCSWRRRSSTTTTRRSSRPSRRW